MSIPEASGVPRPRPNRGLLLLGLLLLAVAVADSGENPCLRRCRERLRAGPRTRAGGEALTPTVPLLLGAPAASAGTALGCTPALPGGQNVPFLRVP